jgi:DNA-binding transcriptional ArsR family regulator
MINSETKYKVQSLERGLAILRELRAADAPVRNQELVLRTGLPKATVSRMLSTLGELGYVRRTDQGSYVLGHASARSGRAMLDALRLERYRSLFDNAPGPVYLEAVAGDRLVPVYRWSVSGAGMFANGSPSIMVSIDRNVSSAQAHYWDADAGVWSAWAGVRVEPVGSFVLTLQVVQSSPPGAEEAEQANVMLQRAAEALAAGSPP